MLGYISVSFYLYPGIRDYDGWVYFREWSGGLMAGGFEPKALPCFQDGIPDNFEFQLLPENWEQFRKFISSSKYGGGVKKAKSRAK